MEKRSFGNVTILEGKNNGRYPYCHTLLIDGPVRVLVDPACGLSKLRAVKEAGDVDVIINTHYHEDHVTGNHLFPEAHVYIHEGDRRGISTVEGYFAQGIDMTREMREQWTAILTEQFHYLGWEPDRLLVDGDELTFGETRVRVIHTPGHTPGHVGLHFPDHDLVYLADLDMTRFGPWYGDRTSDIDAVARSIEKIKAVDARWYVPSHEGPLYEEIGELADAYLRTIEERDRRILENLDEPATLDELAQRWIIYRKPREPQAFFMPSERAMLRKHLDRLVRDGFATLEEKRYVVI